ncbi:unnamed protein product [Pelagomonas calceolata]|uniref:3'-5' exonuclease domain-containing protein n=1 Tax=Pelagomonas calceolata TaxID=35677 RepID=A0A8J2WRK4_9STRA|nr:unnamed protein product [Pelagomonas calceolata]
MQPTQPISSRELRKAVSQARRCDDESCIALVRACPAASIDGGNANGKTALMLAAQFRPTAAVVEELLRRGANVDTTTRRGHTALIFAAGRGRDATIVTLLHAGASACVRTVTGDTALDMARGRASPEVVALLEHAEATGGPWRSFVDDPDALAAQAEHAKTCAVCRAKLGEAFPDDASNEADRREAALAAETAATSERCRAAEDAASLSRALVLSACAAAAASRPTPVRDASKRVLGPALVDAAARDAPTLLRACADGALGRALPTRDRRPIRLVLEALLGGGAVFEPAALVDFARADPQSYATALELYARGGASEPTCATELWKIALEALGRRLHAGEALGVYGVLAASRRRRKSEGGATVDSLVHARAWGVACLPGGDGLDAIDALAVTLGVGAKYSAAIGAPEPPPVAKSAPVVAYASLPPLEPVPTSSVVWVGDAASLDAAGAAVAAASRVAVDTEWGQSGDDDPAAPPALIQAAVGERVYLVDALTLRRTDALGRFVEGLLYGEGPLLGFAFEHDRVRLEALLPAAAGRPRRLVVDLQRAGHVGLRDACATWLGQRLDKSEQCSDWERRPLSHAQVAYAALDASVLFALHDAMCA